MAIKRKPQTEKKAKGLVGWKNGRQVTTSKDTTANKNVGDYKGRTLNLTKKQLGAAGRKAAGARTVDIGKTTFDKSKGGVLGPGGKPLTGRVDLGGGNIAVYKKGVRVRAAASKPKGGSNGGGVDAAKPKYGTRTMGKPGEYQAGRGMVSRPSAADRGTNRGPIAQGDRKPRPNPQQKISISNSGFVRGNKGSSSVANYMAKGMTRSEALRAKRVEDTKNQNRNALGVAALTLGPALAPLLGAPGAASVVGAAGRTAVGRGVTAASRKVVGGGVSKSGKSTSNKVSVAAFKAGRAMKPKVDKALGINFKGSNVKIKPKPTPKKKP